MNAPLRPVEIFCAVVEAGSFTAAATELGVTPAAVSRAIAVHEARIGVQFFRRTTRRMHLTEEGQAYYEPCRQALALIASAERSLSHKQTAPRGRVRLSVPTTYAHHRALAVVARFVEDHPEVSVEVNVSNRNIDFVAEGYDLAVRVGELADSTLVARKLEDAALGVYGSPRYLARHEPPKQPGELAAHKLIGFVRPSTGRLLTWLFQSADGPFEMPIRAAVRCSDDFLGCITLAREGAGLVQAYRFIVERMVARGELVEVLEPWSGRSRPFTLLQPSGREPTLAVRLFADAIVYAWGKAGSMTKQRTSRAKR